MWGLRIAMIAVLLVLVYMLMPTCNAPRRCPPKKKVTFQEYPMVYEYEEDSEIDNAVWLNANPPQAYKDMYKL
jgi:hypothetical protein